MICIELYFVIYANKPILLCIKVKLSNTYYIILKESQNCMVGVYTLKKYS